MHESEYEFQLWKFKSFANGLGLFVIGLIKPIVDRLAVYLGHEVEK